ncbi:MAG: Uncharacterized protein Greene041619_200 [Candidatus Peregrinibacteria bacterium Greene0416_19]|nr:MAG: Uncharacterized protein Greene041619_200 [Candidatus Peregrinibacteria bacterium Greene0416_19]
MPPPPTPPPASPLPGTRSASVDAVTSPPAPPQAPVVLPAVSRAKRMLLLLFIAFYVGFAAWEGVLVALLPDPSGSLKQLVSVGLMSSLIGALAFIGIGLVLLNRITHSEASVRTRQVSLLKVVLTVLPGILISAAVPFLIIREPALRLEVIDPQDTAELVAPVAVTFSAANASEVMRNLGMEPMEYVWDTDADGKPNDRTVTPEFTAIYKRQGIYPVVVRVNLRDGSFRRLVRQLIIPDAVFSVAPIRPVVEKPIRFSIANLLTNPEQLKEVQWDFDGDGAADETVKAPDVAHTYFTTGRMPVTAIVLLQDDSQRTYSRTISVEVPHPLPFPVTITAEPKNLIGPVPFGAILRLETQEPVAEVSWEFGDGKEERGKDLLRAAHIFEQPGIYPVITQVRSQSGKMAELTTIVRATEVLDIPDLQFEGEPEVTGSAVRGEVPLAVRLTPKTSLPLIQFSWETGEGFTGQATGITVQGVYRREGTFTLTLIAQNPEGKALRMPISVQVDASGAEPAIAAQPEGGTAPLTVTFDASESFIPPGKKVAGFKWFFGDEKDTSPELGAARVQHTYKIPGEFKVRVVVVMADGKEFPAERTLVVRRPALSACVTSSRLSVQVGKGIEFDSSCSAGQPASYLWDVRSAQDPLSVLAQSPDRQYRYVFDLPGAYTVNLTITDAFGNQDQKSVSIDVTP